MKKELPDIYIDPKKMGHIEKGGYLIRPRKITPKKVYCGNCKYYYHSYSRYGYQPSKHICRKLSNCYKDAIGIDMIKDIIDCYKQNENNDCSHYKRQGWKFWII